jgi:hypothetical protein
VTVEFTLPGASAVPKLPGCCLPSGKCGGSSHTLVETFGPAIPLACASNEDVGAYFALLSQPFAGDADVNAWFTVSEDPSQDCSYLPGAAEGGPPSDSSAPSSDAGNDGGTTPAEAGAVDASTD